MGGRGVTSPHPRYLRACVEVTNTELKDQVDHFQIQTQQVIGGRGAQDLSALLLPKRLHKKLNATNFSKLN